MGEVDPLSLPERKAIRRGHPDPSDVQGPRPEVLDEHRVAGGQRTQGDGTRHRGIPADDSARHRWDPSLSGIRRDEEEKPESDPRVPGNSEDDCDWVDDGADEARD